MLQSVVLESVVLESLVLESLVLEWSCLKRVLESRFDGDGQQAAKGLDIQQLSMQRLSCYRGTKAIARVEREEAPHRPKACVTLVVCEDMGLARHGDCLNPLCMPLTVRS